MAWLLPQACALGILGQIDLLAGHVQKYDYAPSYFVLRKFFPCPPPALQTLVENVFGARTMSAYPQIAILQAGRYSASGAANLALLAKAGRHRSPTYYQTYPKNVPCICQAHTKLLPKKPQKGRSTHPLGFSFLLVLAANPGLVGMIAAC